MKPRKFGLQVTFFLVEPSRNQTCNPPFLVGTSAFYSISGRLSSLDPRVASVNDWEIRCRVIGRGQEISCVLPTPCLGISLCRFINGLPIGASVHAYDGTGLAGQSRRRIPPYSPACTGCGYIPMSSTMSAAWAPWRFHVCPWASTLWIFTSRVRVV
jgi:hypothetical protein